MQDVLPIIILPVPEERHETISLVKMRTEIYNHVIIANIAQAHEGSLGIAYSYIDALAACGVDSVKSQTHIAEA